MKRLTIALIAIMALSLSSCSIFNGGDKAFEGTIKYSIDYEGDIDAEILASAPTSVTQLYKGTKVRKDQETAMYSVGTIVDNATGETTLLMDIPMMGQKIAFKQSKEEIEEALAEVEEEMKPVYNETGETKEILGYTCKKIDMELGEDIYPVYYTTEINIESHKNDFPFDGINGVILEYTVNQNGMVTHQVANEVKKQKLGADKFSIPEDYTEKTADEMKALFGM